RILIYQRNATEMMAAVDILVQERRPDMPEVGIDDGGFAAEQADSAANAHRGDGRIDLHALASVSDLSGDEGEGAFHEAEDGAVRRAVVSLEVVFVERHPRVVDEVKRRAVREGDAASRIGTGLD